jgi:hypothetical protein
MSNDVVAQLARDRTHARRDLRRGHERVVADPHGRRPRVILHAVDGQARPRDGDDAVDHADVQSFLLEERTLLDVQLEVGAKRPRHARLGAEIADALQLVHEPDAVLVARVVGVLEGDLARHDAAGDHGRLKARALLVGEDHERDRMPRAQPVVVERANGLEPAQHAELAIVLAAGRDRVRMGAHHDGRQGLGARALAEDVAHLIDGHSQPGLAHPADHEVSPPAVVVGQRQARETAARRLADPPQFLDGSLQPRAVDPRCAVGHRP